MLDSFAQVVCLAWTKPQNLPITSAQANAIIPLSNSGGATERIGGIDNLNLIYFE